MIRVLPNVSVHNCPVCFCQRDTRTEGDRSLLPYMTLQPYDIELVHVVSVRAASVLPFVSAHWITADEPNLFNLSSPLLIKNWSFKNYLKKFSREIGSVHQTFYICSLEICPFELVSNLFSYMTRSDKPWGGITDCQLSTLPQSQERSLWQPQIDYKNSLMKLLDRGVLFLRFITAVILNDLGG